MVAYICTPFLFAMRFLYKVQRITFRNYLLSKVHLIFYLSINIKIWLPIELEMLVIKNMIIKAEKIVDKTVKEPDE